MREGDPFSILAFSPGFANDLRLALPISMETPEGDGNPPTSKALRPNFRCIWQMLDLFDGSAQGPYCSGDWRLSGDPEEDKKDMEEDGKSLFGEERWQSWGGIDKEYRMPREALPLLQRAFALAFHRACSDETPMPEELHTEDGVKSLEDSDAWILIWVELGMLHTRLYPVLVKGLRKEGKAYYPLLDDQLQDLISSGYHSPSSVVLQDHVSVEVLRYLQEWERHMGLLLTHGEEPIEEHRKMSVEKTNQANFTLLKIIAMHLKFSNPLPPHCVEKFEQFIKEKVDGHADDAIRVLDVYRGCCGNNEVPGPISWFEKEWTVTGMWSWSMSPGVSSYFGRSSYMKRSLHLGSIGGVMIGLPGVANYGRVPDRIKELHLRFSKEMRKHSYPLNNVALTNECEVLCLAKASAGESRSWV